MVFIIHRLKTLVAVSEKVPTETDTPQFQVRQLIQKNGRRVQFGAALTTGETGLVDRLLPAFIRVERRLKQMETLDPSMCAKGIQDISEIAILDGLFRYIKSEYIFQAALQKYEKQDPHPRFGTAVALDVYRQCCGRLALGTGLRLIAQDLPILRKKLLSNHYRESAYDVFYEISMRAGRLDAAIEHLAAAFQITQTPARAEGLINALIANRAAGDAKVYLDYLRSVGGSHPALEERYATAVAAAPVAPPA